MVDRLFIILMVVFALVGAFSFDQSMRKNGGVSPLGRIIDFAGLSKWRTDDTTRNTKRHDSFKLDLQSNLSRLQEKHKQIEEKRAQLIAHRKEILEKLMGVNGQVQGQAEYYKKVIDGERKKLKAQFPELEELGSSLVSVAKVTDEKLRAQRFQDIKGQIITSLHKIVENPEKDTPRLMNILDKIEAIVGRSSNGQVEECGDIEVCLKQKVVEVETELNQYFDSLMQQPERDLGQLLELSQLLQQEYQSQVDEIQASEQKWKESDERVEGNMKKLVEQLVATTDSDMQDLMRLYRELNQEQEEMVKYLDLNRHALRGSYDRYSQQFKDVLRNLRSNPRLDLSSLTDTYQKLDSQSQDLLTQSSDDSDALIKLVQEQGSENKKSAEEMGAALNVDLKRMIEDDFYAQEMVNQYQQDHSQLREKLAEVKRQRKEQSDYQKDKQKDIRRQLDNLRNRSKDQGF